MISEVKVLDRRAPANKLVIWQPRWKDRTVLLAKFKVGVHNEIVFTKAPSMGDNSFYISGEEVRKCPTDTNGSIAVYAVPLDKLRILERQ